MWRRLTRLVLHENAPVLEKTDIPSSPLGPLNEVPVRDSMRFAGQFVVWEATLRAHLRRQVEPSVLPFVGLVRSLYEVSQIPLLVPGAEHADGGRRLDAEQVRCRDEDLK